MSGDATPAAPPPLPSVFLSYASADRAAARALRDTLATAGLEVWLDEEELAGGEAWDAKIRNQIRTCTFFMPVISATTEARREGYFRREWRLAVERTLDLADDVMFLVPVVIDATRDAGARVPEKFVTVQWLRVPGGLPTPELRQLAAKLVAGDALALPAAAADVVPPARTERKDRKKPADAPPPPFPAFPPYPEPGHHFRFLYNIVLWAGHMVHALWMRLPRTVRVIASIVIVFNIITWAFRRGEPAGAHKEKAEAAAEIAKDLAANLGEKKDSSASDRIKSLVGVAAHALQTGRPLAIVTFGGDETGSAYAGDVFTETYKLLQGTGGQVSLSPIPLEADDDDDDALARGTKLESQFVLTGFAHHAAPGDPLLLTAKLYQVKPRTVIWSESFDPAKIDAIAAAKRVAEAARSRALPAANP